MTYTTKEYAEAAHQANMQGKILEVIDGKFVFTEPPEPENLATEPALENPLAVEHHAKPGDLS